MHEQGSRGAREQGSNVMAEAIEFENVSKRFILHHARPRSFQELVIGALWRSRSREELWALNDVSFGVERGEMLGIIGPNGSGKSTLLKLITRILEPTSGRITVDGKVSALIELGAGFHPDLTGRENVYLNGSILGLSQEETDAKFKEIVEFAELERFINVPLKHYSSGMYMRLGFAIAINVEPDILLIDEVLAVGDESFQKKCLAKIEELKNQGKTMVFVSHALETVRKLCDQALWLEEGNIKSRGNPDKVIYDYLDDLRRKEGVALDEKHRHLRYELEEQQLENRWGSGEVEICDVELLDGDGEEKHVYQTGDTMIIRLYYEVKEPVAAPPSPPEARGESQLTFGVGIHRSDGLHIHGTNTFAQKVHYDAREGEGVVELEYGELPLSTGTYAVSVGVWPGDKWQLPYDMHSQLYQFSVWGAEDEGLIMLPHRWLGGQPLDTSWKLEVETSPPKLGGIEGGRVLGSLKFERLPTHVLMGENDAHCLDGGWHEVEDWPPKVRWTTKRASLLLMPDGSSSRLSMIAWCPQPALTPQSGRVYVDGRVVGKFDLTGTDPRTFSFRLPQPNVDKAIKVTIEVKRTLIPAEAGLGEDRRELGVAVQEIWTD
ncbi:MAG: ABC transporter ATP-binding protein [Anaerolineales bacterium]|nr:ABC transporter ATP-binding protein [Anaerolineales bacterium]